VTIAMGSWSELCGKGVSSFAICGFLLASVKTRMD